MMGAVSPDARPGDLVNVYEPYGQPFGVGLYNPRAKVPLRVLRHGTTPASEGEITAAIERAVSFRLDVLFAGTSSNAYRVIHSDGDGLSGLVVDRFGDTLSVQVHSLGMAQRLGKILPLLHERLGTKRAVAEVDPAVARIESIPESMLPSDPVRIARIEENGVKYEVDFSTGHKTGFFCDQRDNRRRFAALAKGRRVLDLCCYTGGFTLSALVAGGAESATGVDLDEKAAEQAKRNGNINHVKPEWVHCDAFAYARQMKNNGRQWDLVALDPPKLVHSRDELRESMQQYEDLNALAMTLVAPGGLFLTCSCSGLLSTYDFERLVSKAAHRLDRRLQIFEHTEAAPDHPVMSNCPEGQYLKAVWARVW
jgi:23S rRNA (cytosine1962-C5)-methyltransferase